MGAEYGVFVARELTYTSAILDNGCGGRGQLVLHWHRGALGWGSWCFGRGWRCHRAGRLGCRWGVDRKPLADYNYIIDREVIL